MKSEIFEAYAAEMETLLEGRDDLVKEARTPKQIQKDLYGIVPNKKMKPILERAHPHGGYVVAPAYDPANGVMATPGETQALVGGVANSDANGNYFQKSWIQATEDLKEELIGIAFELDNKEELELMKLADSCAERLEKKSSLIANGTGVLSVAAWLVKKVAVFALPFLGMTLLDKALSGGGPRASGAATTSRGAEKAAAGRIRSIKRSLPAVGRMGVIGVKLGAFYFAFKGLANLIGPISQGLDNDAQDVLGAIEEAIPEVGPQDGQRLREIGARVTGLMESSRSWQQAAAQVPAEAPSAERQEDFIMLTSQLDAFRMASLHYEAKLDQMAGYLKKQAKFLGNAAKNEANLGPEARLLRGVYRKAFPHELDQAIAYIRTLEGSVKSARKDVKAGLKRTEAAAKTLYQRSLPVAQQKVDQMGDQLIEEEESWLNSIPVVGKVKEVVSEKWDDLRGAET